MCLATLLDWYAFFHAWMLIQLWLYKKSCGYNEWFAEIVCFIHKKHTQMFTHKWVFVYP